MSASLLRPRLAEVSSYPANAGPRVLRTRSSNCRSRALRAAWRAQRTLPPLELWSAQRAACLSGCCGPSPRRSAVTAQGERGFGHAGGPRRPAVRILVLGPAISRPHRGDVQRATCTGSAQHFAREIKTDSIKLAYISAPGPSGGQNQAGIYLADHRFGSASRSHGGANRSLGRRGATESILGSVYRTAEQRPEDIES